jgi:signal transduction histidine kinase
LVTSYAVLFVIVPITSYLMARAALRPIRLSYERQERFVDGASHELRTPLSIIQGELELVTSRTRSVAEYENAIAISLEEIESLTQLTNDLLLLSHSEGRYPNSAMTTFALNELVLEATKQENSPRRPDGPPLAVTLGRPTMVTASRSLVLRAIVNIVDNALKFTPAGGEVTVTTDLVNGDPAITVTDTGIGMSRKGIAHASDRFWRADEARSRPGHGVGLALVRQIMDAHGGTLTITSTEGVGTTAQLVFPRRRA